MKQRFETTRPTLLLPPEHIEAWRIVLAKDRESGRPQVDGDRMSGATLSGKSDEEELLHDER